MLVTEVIEVTNLDWDRVWEMGIYEFFNIVAFSRERSRRKEQAIKKWQKTH